jgi:hypothetical protein
MPNRSRLQWRELLRHIWTLVVNRQERRGMSYLDPALRLYSANGIRSAEDWKSRGRDVAEGAEPRTRVQVSGKEISLFTVDQTHSRPRSERHGASRVKVAAPTPSV